MATLRYLVRFLIVGALCILVALVLVMMAYELGFRGLNISTFASAVQIVALPLILYELRQQIENRRQPEIVIRVVPGTVYFYYFNDVGAPRKLQRDIPTIDETDGRISILLFNVGKANLNGMKVRMYVEQNGVPLGGDRFRPPLIHRHMADQADTHVWESTDIMTRLVKDECLPIVMHVIPIPNSSDSITLHVDVIGDNLKVPVRETLTISYPAQTWKFLIETEAPAQRSLWELGRSAIGFMFGPKS